MVGFDKEVYCTTCCPKVGLAQDITDTSKIKGNVSNFGHFMTKIKVGNIGFFSKVVRMKMIHVLSAKEKSSKLKKSKLRNSASTRIVSNVSPVQSIWILCLSMKILMVPYFAKIVTLANTLLEEEISIYLIIKVLKGKIVPQPPHL